MAWTTPGTATAGEVLTASRWNTDVRDNTQHLYDTMGLEVITPSSVSGTGVTLSGAKVSTSASTAITINGVFSSSYDMVRMVWYGKNGSVNDVDLRFQFRDASSAIGGTAYSYVFIQAYVSATGAGGANSTSLWVVGAFSQTNNSHGIVDIYGAGQATAKSMSCQNPHMQSAATIDSRTLYGAMTTATAYQGVQLTPASGSFTGAIRFYGYKNS